MGLQPLQDWVLISSRRKKAGRRKTMIVMNNCGSMELATVILP